MVVSRRGGSASRTMKSPHADAHMGVGSVRGHNSPREESVWATIISQIIGMRRPFTRSIWIFAEAERADARQWL